MGKREQDQFNKWAKEVAAKLPENLRNSWVAVTDNDYPEREELMNGFLRQEDYTRKTTDLSKRADELESARQELEGQRQQLVDWYQGTNTEYQRMYSEYNRMNGTDPNRSNASEELQAMKREKDALLQRIQQVDQGAWTMATQLSALSHRALKDGYSFDPNAIAAYSAKNHVPLETSWEILTREERKAKADEDIQKRIETAREEARREAMSKMASPDSFGNTTPTNSVVDSIRNNTGISDDQKRREQALKDFYEAGQA